jgi:hypothetical protein
VSLQTLKDNPRTGLFTIEFLLSGIAIAVVCWKAPAVLVFTRFGPGDVVKLLTPLFLTALFIERAVEILVSPWRDQEATKLAASVASAKSDPRSTPQTIDGLQQRLTDYRSQTQRIAFGASFVLGLMAAMAGVNALGIFLDAGKLNLLAHWQNLFVHAYDVILTAALLSGGADGIHSLMSAITSFLNATSDKASKAAAA